MIVTDNLLFLSTRTRLYAISLTDPCAIAWSASTPGNLVISQNAKLIVTPFRGTTGTPVVTAYALR